MRLGLDDGGCSTAARYVNTLGVGAEALTDEGFDRVHAYVARPFSSEHVRKFWTKKMQRTLGKS
jgi:hypothetical protein